MWGNLGIAFGGQKTTKENYILIDLGKLRITIETGADEAKKELNDLGQTADQQENKFAKFSSTIKKGLAIGGAAAVVKKVTDGIMDMATNTSEASREVDRLSQQTGMSTTAYQEWDYVMKQLGFSMEQAAGDFSALGEKALDAANETGEGAELFGKLGVAVTDTSGKMKSQEQIFQETITALQGMEDVTERNAIASALLGTTGEELTSILNMTGEEVDAMKNKAHELGAVMSEETVGAGVKLGQSMDDAKAAFGGVVTELASAFMPMLQSLLSWVLDNMPTIKKVISVVMEVLKKYLEIGAYWWGVLFDIMKVVYDWIEPYFPIIQEIVETTFGAIGKAVQIVTDIFWGVVDAIKAAISWLQSWNNTEADDKNVSGSGNNRPYRSSNASGLNYVPFNNYVANLHEGEMVLTKDQAEQYRNNTTNNSVTITGNNFVIREEADIQKISRELQRQIRGKQRGTALA